MLDPTRVEENTESQGTWSLGGARGKSIEILRGRKNAFPHQANGDWSGTEYAPDTGYAWYLFFCNGLQYANGENGGFYALV
jgi:hypothetical protein